MKSYGLCWTFGVFLNLPMLQLTEKYTDRPILCVNIVCMKFSPPMADCREERPCRISSQPKEVVSLIFFQYLEMLNPSRGSILNPRVCAEDNVGANLKFWISTNHLSRATHIWDKENDQYELFWVSEML